MTRPSLEAKTFGSISVVFAAKSEHSSAARLNSSISLEAMPYNVDALVQFHFPHSRDVPITGFAESAFEVLA
jgi:hypothetical protein